jgi:hypothetical protein
MRKYIRNIIRCRAKQENIKPSIHVKTMFDYLQRKNYGADKRKRNQARGTHKPKVWSFREAMITSR